MEQDDKLRKITKNFGIETELTKLSEEVGELLNECYKHYYIGEGLNNIEDELADVYVLLSQIELFFKADTIKIGEIVEQKINRTVKRIDEGWYDRHR